MTTKAGWRRSGNSAGCCGKKTNTAGDKKGRKWTATQFCSRRKRAEARKLPQWQKARRQISPSFIISKVEKSLEVSMKWLTSRNFKSKFFFSDCLFKYCIEILYVAECVQCVCVSSRASLEDRLQLEEQQGISVADTAVGSKQLTFTLKKVCSSLFSTGTFMD